MQASGEIQSFNYKIEVTGDNPNHLANLNYAICIRIESGFCGIKYSQPVTDPYSFTISLDASGVSTATVKNYLLTVYGISIRWLLSDFSIGCRWREIW